MTYFAQILAYKGIKTLIMNGTLKREERDQVIDEFVHGDDPEKRVLLFSSVGAVGLNLTCADVVIMLVSTLSISMLWIGN